MQPVRRASLISQVTEQLRNEIRSGTWPIGSKIPTEPELSELTGTGRNTVREAVQALVHAGMLERRQGSGTYVVAVSDLGGTLGNYFARCPPAGCISNYGAHSTSPRPPSPPHGEPKTTSPN